MAVVRALSLVLAIVAVLCLPTVLALVICADDVWDRFGDWLARRRQQRWIRRGIDRLDRLIEADSVYRDTDLASLDSVTGPPIEQLAADLRRLRSQRLDLATRSPLWYDAVNHAYDDRLRQASRRLAVEEHLGELDGVDREIERVRVEGELQAAGLLLGDPVARRRPEPG